MAAMTSSSNDWRAGVAAAMTAGSTGAERRLRSWSISLRIAIPQIHAPTSPSPRYFRAVRQTVRKVSWIAV